MAAKHFIDFRKMASDFTSFSLEALKGLDNIPKATLTNYQDIKKGGKAPLLFHRIPHIHYQGSLSSNEMTLVTTRPLSQTRSFKHDLLPSNGQL